MFRLQQQQQPPTGGSEWATGQRQAADDAPVIVRSRATWIRHVRLLLPDELHPWLHLLLLLQLLRLQQALPLLLLQPLLQPLLLHLDQLLLLLHG